MRVVASLNNEPRADCDAQRPLEDDGAAAAVQPLALPAPGGDAPSGMTDTGDMQPASAELVGNRSANLPPIPAAAQAGDQRAAAADGGPQPEVPPVSQPDATQAQVLRPADASAPAVSTEGGLPAAAGVLDASVLSADVTAFDGRQTSDAAPDASAAPQSQAVVAASDADLDTKQGAQEQAPGFGASFAQQPIGPHAPAGQATASVPSADLSPAVPPPDPATQPQPLAAAAAAGKQPSQQQVAAAPPAPPSEPPSPQPPPPPQLLLLPDDASAEEVQEGALSAFRELYPIFEPFQVRGSLSMLGTCGPCRPYLVASWLDDSDWSSIHVRI